MVDTIEVWRKAALIGSAIPGFTPAQVVVGTAIHPAAQTLHIADDQGRVLTLYLPQSGPANSFVKRQMAVLLLLNDAYEREVWDVRVPAPLAQIALDTGFQALVVEQVEGDPLRGRDLSQAAVGAGVGRALAGLHQIEPAHFAASGISVYSPDQWADYLYSRLQVAQEGARIKDEVAEYLVGQLRSWPDFRPCLVHADLHPTALYLHSTDVVGMVDFEQLLIADPALDLAWILGAGDSQFIRSAQRAYNEAGGWWDEAVTERATVLQDFQAVRWLAVGVESEAGDIIADGEAMVNEIAIPTSTP